MALLNMDLLFPKKKTGTNFFNTNYDVSIVANKGHNGKNVYRFTFINKGLEVASKYQYVVVSSVAYSKCNIYFQFLNNKPDNSKGKDIHFHKMSEFFTKDNILTQKTFTITPLDDERAIYEKYWVGKTCKLLWDVENKLDYIQSNIPD